MSGVASILATLGLDKSSFSQTLRRAEAEAKGGASAIAGAFGGVSGLSMLGGGLSAAGIGLAVKGLTDYGARVQHLSDRFGVSTDAIQRFGNAAEQNGSSLDAVAMGFNKMEIARSKAMHGDEAMQEAFSRLNVSMTDLRSLTPEAIMDKLAGSSLNAADMVKLLGKNALELRPILHGLATGTIEYGEAINSIDVKRLEEADKTWKKLFEKGRVIGAEAISGFGDRMVQSLKDSGTEAKAFGNIFSNFFTAKNKDQALKSSRDLWAALKADWTGNQKFFDQAAKLPGAPGAAGKALAAGAKKKGGPLPEEDEIGDAISSIKERAKLSLAELAGRDAYGEEAIYRNRYIGGDIVKAQAAMRERGLAEDASFAGRDEEARTHLTKFQQLTGGIGSLREADKGLGAFEKALKPTETKLDKIVTNTEKQFVNK